MADDFLTAAAGFLEGVKNVYVPSQQAKFQDALTAKRRKQEQMDDLAILPQKAEIEAEALARKTGMVEAAKLPYQKELRGADDYISGADILAGNPKANVKPDGKYHKSLVSMFSPESGSDPGLNILIRGRDAELRKAMGEANPQRTSIPTINKLLKMIDTEGVTGKGGQLKAVLAPYAEAAGFSSEDWENAQSYQLLSRLMAGPLRMDIVGSGQVSNYEQQLLQELSGGGGASKRAAKELLNYYKGVAKRKVNDYNSLVQNSVSLSPRFNDIYKPISVEEDEFVDPGQMVGGGGDPVTKAIQSQLPKGAKIKRIKRMD